MMNNIIFITGMSGSGKSTISRGVAEHFPQAMHLDVDQLRQMMVAGRAKPGQPDIVREEWVKQLQLARSTATYMANLYASQGVDVVIDDFCWPPNFPEYYAALFENPAVHRVLLLPTQSALAERIIKRGGPFANETRPPSDTPPSEQLHSINLPTLILVGERDLPDFQAMAEFMVQHIPNAAKVVLSGVGHMSNMEDPTRFNEIVLGFLLKI